MGLDASTVTFGALCLHRYDLLHKLLASALRGTYVPIRWHIVDNGGRLVDHFKEHPIDLPGDVLIDAPGTNIGVAPGWNRIIDRGLPGAVMLFNDDIVLGERTLELLVSTGSADKPIVCAHNFGAFYQHPSMLERVGHYDENFWPAYYEDTDYQYRMKLSGIALTTVDGRCVHDTSATAKTYSDPAWFEKRSQLSGGYYCRKWGGPWSTERWTAPFNRMPPRNWNLRCITAGQRPLSDQGFRPVRNRTRRRVPA